MASNSRQERANARAKSWGFKNDYQMRKFIKANGIQGTRGNRRNKRIFEALEDPAQIRQAFRSGRGGEYYRAEGLREWDKKKKEWVPISDRKILEYIRGMQKKPEQNEKGQNISFRLPSKLTHKYDWTQVDLMLRNDFSANDIAPKAKMDALLFTLVVADGWTVDEFKKRYRDLIIANGMDMVEFEEYYNDMLELLGAL